MDESQARKLIIEIGKLLYERSYVVSSDGNVSIRLDENRVLATPTMTCKGRMTEDCLAITDLDGKPLNDRGLASRLRKYGVKPKVVRVGDATPRGYTREDLHDAWARYLSPLSPESATSATSATEAAFHG